MMLGMFAIICLTFLGYTKGTDVSLAIAGVVASVASANAFQKKGVGDEPAA
jgi:hypothetical protein